MGPAQGHPSTEEADSQRLRLTFLALMVVSLFVLLFARLWFLQVMAGERYTDLALGNAVRTLVVDAPRGKILDRHGNPLVRNRHAKVVSVQPLEMGERRDEILTELADLLGLPAGEVVERAERSRVSPFRPKPIAVDVPAEIVFYIHENRASRFPGVYAETLPVRAYDHGSLAAHLVGYVGEISADELDQPRYEDHRAGELIGWAGLERSFQDVLRGEEGQRQLEVNARGEVLGDLGQTPPVPGSDLVLALDLEAQRVAEEALAEGMEVARRTADRGAGPLRGGTFKAPAGAVVVLDPSNGEVLAMTSRPTFDPERFVGGIAEQDWEELQDPGNHFPLINRAVQSAYPPGSVFKIVPAAAALEEGYMTPGSTLPCPGSWDWGGTRWNNWTSAHSGMLDVVGSLVRSCDTVYYELARRMWEHEQRTGAERELMSEYATGFGFGRATGIDLPVEQDGVVPSRGWKRTFWEEAKDTYCTKAQTLDSGSYAQAVNADLCESGFRWRGGDAVNMSIGQGEMLTTPLQIANAFAAAANGGTLYRPHVVREIRHRDGRVEAVEPEVIAELPLEDRHLALLQRGLEGVTGAGGTAASVFGGFPVEVAGKTGTAEMKPKQPFAWFVGYAPADEPKYVVVALVEEGGGGSQTAAPIVRRVFEGLLDLEASTIDLGEPTD